MNDNIPSSFSHSEANSKSSDSVPNAINHLLQCLNNNDVEKIKEKLHETNLALGTLNMILNKAYAAFKQGNSHAKEIIHVLLSYGADPNLNLNSYLKDKKAQTGLFTGLMLASAENDVDLASIIASHGANVNIKDTFGRNALFFALNSTKGDIKEMIMLLIRNDININESDNEGQTALTIAVNKNLKLVVKILLDNGADVDHVVFKDGNTAMHYGVIQNKQETIRLLLAKKPNLTIRNRNGEKAVDIVAQISNRTDIYSLLAEEYSNQIKMKKEEPVVNNNVNLSVNSNNSNELLNEEEGESGGILQSDEGSQQYLGVNGQPGHNFANLQQNLKIEKNTTGGIFFQGTASSSVSNNTSQVPSSQTNVNQASGTTQNINISINNQNNLVNFQQEIKRMKTPSLKKLYHKQMKYEHSKSMKDYVYKFPLQNNNISHIEIPFNFQNNLELNSTNSSTNEIQSPPTLFLDISDETKQEKLALSCLIEELKMNNFNQANKINSLEANFYGSVEENEKLKAEISKLKEELEQKDSIINDLNSDLGQKEAELAAKTCDFHEKLEDKNLALKLLLEKYEKMEKELMELKSREMLTGQDFLFSKDLVSKKDFLDKKFSCSKYDDKYIIKCLQKDLIDFQDHSKDLIRKVKASQEELLRLIQEAVTECIPEYEVKLYGSHATNLCLQWSDLDLVLIHKRNFNVTNYGALQTLYINLMEKTWKKSIKFIDTAMIPLIKMTSSDQFNSMHIDISLQDSKHYGLRCVDLVKSFMREYEALEPLLFALKNILRNANLNDPYTGGLSSYGLILMVVSFLQTQQETKKSIKITDGNLGRLFLEFLWYYGLYFDHSKYVIYAFPANETSADKEAITFHYNLQPSHELIIVDPLSKNNNVARSTYQFVNIKMAFMIGFVVSHEECECGCHFNKPGEEFSVYNLDHCILKRIFNSVKRFNANTGSA